MVDCAFGNRGWKESGGRMKQKTKLQLEESYRHIKPYINDDEELKKLCECCECYCGNNHNYEDCKNNQCFKMYLAYRYLEWCNSW